MVAVEFKRFDLEAATRPMPDSVEALIRKTPLYLPFNLGLRSKMVFIMSQHTTPEGFAHAHLKAIHDYQHTVDEYCVGCGTPSIFKGLQGAEVPVVESEILVKTFVCSRASQHTVRFVFSWRKEDFILKAEKVIGKPELEALFGTKDPSLPWRAFTYYRFEKIGQWPSLVELSTAELAKYRRGLDDGDHYRELNRAVGLRAYGVGTGSFVYLRRIFERLIDEAHKRAMASPDWDEAEFSEEARIADKIQALRKFLPAFLVDNRNLYGILSAGVHTLSEEECLKHFELVYQGIRLILDEEIHRKEERERVEEAKRALGQLSSEIKAQESDAAEG